MKPKAKRSSRIVSYRTKTNLAVERCEPRLALDASQVPESQPIDEGFLEVIQPAPTFTLNSNVGGRLRGQGGFANGGFINYGDIFSESISVNAIVASPDSKVRFPTNDSGFDSVFSASGDSNAGDTLAISVLGEKTEITVDFVPMYSHLMYGSLSIDVDDFLIEKNSTNDRAFSISAFAYEFASGDVSFTVEVSSNGLVQDSLNSLSEFEPMKVSSVGEKQPKASNEGTLLTTSLSKHHHIDPAVLHVSSLQTISFESVRSVSRADQVFTVLAGNDGTQVATPQSQMARGAPSSTGFLDVQATIAGIDSAQKTLFDAVVFDTENGSSLFEENVHQDNTNSMPVMARATLFEVAEYRVPALPREVLGGHDGEEKNTGGEKVVASPTLPHDSLVASGDSDNWVSNDLSLYVRLSLAAAFATTTFELDKRYHSNDFSTNNANDTNAK